MENCRKKEEETVKLEESFYLSDDVVQLAQELLGKYLFTFIDGKLTGGQIIETESYKGPEDRASHAYNNRRTKRTEVMFHKGGICYVYLCYGIHNLLNIVTNVEGTPHAILIRAIAPMIGVDVMQRRRKKDDLKTLTNGPGSVARALGVDMSLNGQPLTENVIWIEEKGILRKKIEASPRVGVDYAGKDALLPWRFRLV